MIEVYIEANPVCLAVYHFGMLEKSVFLLGVTDFFVEALDHIV